MSEVRKFAENTEVFPANLSLFPWEEVDAIIRQQVEDEIWSDEEHDAWLAALVADDPSTSSGYAVGELVEPTGSDPCYERWVEAGAPGVVWSLLDDASVMAEVWPDYQRDDWVGV
jgi:hypothetical protein